MTNNYDRFKFRVWDIENKKWAMSFDMNSNKHDSPITISIPANGNFIIQQCTGVMDCEGNLIFEGDIIRALSEDENDREYEFIGDIQFENGMFCFGGIGLFTMNLFRSFMITGNIFEKTELLENK